MERAIIPPPVSSGARAGDKPRHCPPLHTVVSQWQRLAARVPWMSFLFLPSWHPHPHCQVSEPLRPLGAWPPYEVTCPHTCAHPRLDPPFAPLPSPPLSRTLPPPTFLLIAALNTQPRASGCPQQGTFIRADQGPQIPLLCPALQSEHMAWWGAVRTHRSRLSWSAPSWGQPGGRWTRSCSQGWLPGGGDTWLTLCPSTPNVSCVANRWSLGMGTSDLPPTNVGLRSVGAACSLSPVMHRSSFIPG